MNSIRSQTYIEKNRFRITRHAAELFRNALKKRGMWMPVEDASKPMTADANFGCISVGLGARRLVFVLSTPTIGRLVVAELVVYVTVYNVTEKFYNEASCGGAVNCLIKNTEDKLHDKCLIQTVVTSNKRTLASNISETICRMFDVQVFDTKLCYTAFELLDAEIQHSVSGSVVPSIRCLRPYMSPENYSDTINDALAVYHKRLTSNKRSK
jgi:hypothetical protein